MSLSESIPLCDPYIWEDPRYIFRMTWFDSASARGTCASELINQIICAYLFAFILGIIGSGITGIHATPVVFFMGASLYLIPVFLQLKSIQSFQKNAYNASSGPSGGSNSEGESGSSDSGSSGNEGFQNEDSEDTPTNFPKATKLDCSPPGSVKGKLDVLPFQLGTSPTVKNPFHNVLVSEIKDYPLRPGAPDVTSLKSKIALDEYFRVNWYNDPTDIFGKSQSQRMFVTQPSTTIPNDQESYQNWLYKIEGKTCKEGGVSQCYGGTNGAVRPFLNL